MQQIKLKQWFFRITAFQDALLNDLVHLEKENRWPERVISQQRNWLGKSKGVRIRFKLKSSIPGVEYVDVFTTRPETLFGVTFIALSISHPIVLQLLESCPEMQEFLAQKSSWSPDFKGGYKLHSVWAINPLSEWLEYCQKPIPVIVAPYVLDEYGSGAVMGVPGHDERDLVFYKQNYPSEKVPIVVSDQAYPKLLEPLAQDLVQAFPNPGNLTVLCGTYAGLSTSDAREMVTQDLEERGFAESVSMWRLRDWLVSRQRYWGTPIPVIHCKHCGAVPVPDDHLPVELPELPTSMRGVSGNPLEKIESWVNAPCPSCGAPAKRETDTMDTFVDSSWYFLRFPDVSNIREPFSFRSASTMLPVDTYVGGVEHAILHLLYARFMYKFFCSEGLIEDDEIQEPFTQLISQGMVHGKTFSDPQTGRFLRPEEVSNPDTNPTIAATGLVPSITWEKMSKSKYNGIDPINCISKYGADAIRAHILFAAPLSEVLLWDEEKIIGIQRWFFKIARLVTQFQETDVSSDSEMISTADSQRPPNLLKGLLSPNVDAFLLTQKTIKSVTHTYEKHIYGLNTTVSDLTKLTNGLLSLGLDKLAPWVAYDSLSALLRMLAPIAPAFAEQCWEDLHRQLDKTKATSSVLTSHWPKLALDTDLEAHISKILQTTTCTVQVNGKLRFTTQIPAMRTDQAVSDKESDALLVSSILSTDEGRYWLQQRNDWESRKRVIIVGGGRLVNVVF